MGVARLEDMEVRVAAAGVALRRRVGCWSRRAASAVSAMERWSSATGPPGSACRTRRRPGPRGREGRCPSRSGGAGTRRLRQRGVRALGRRCPPSISSLPWRRHAAATVPTAVADERMVVLAGIPSSAVRSLAPTAIMSTPSTAAMASAWRCPPASRSDLDDGGGVEPRVEHPPPESGCIPISGTRRAGSAGRGAESGRRAHGARLVGRLDPSGHDPLSASVEQPADHAVLALGTRTNGVSPVTRPQRRAPPPRRAASSSAPGQPGWRGAR